MGKVREAGAAAQVGDTIVGRTYDPRKHLAGAPQIRATLVENDLEIGQPTGQVCASRRSSTGQMVIDKIIDEVTSPTRASLTTATATARA